jgi:hypothetical protein
MLLGGGARHTKRNCAERQEKRATVPHCDTSWRAVLIDVLKLGLR